MRAPTYLADKKCHEFVLESPPTFEHLTAKQIELPLGSAPLKEQFRAFCNEFLVQAGTHFSRPLPTDIFLQRVVHEWQADEYDPDEIQLDGSTTFRVGWAPARIQFAASRYTILWTLTTFEVFVPVKHKPPAVAAAPAPAAPLPPAPAAPAPAAAPPPAVETLPEIHLDSAATAAPAPAATESQIPFQPDSKTLEWRERLKQKVRKARLRVALAQIRAERLAELYYMRYGVEGDGVDSDSDLSYEPEGVVRKI